MLGPSRCTGKRCRGCGWDLGWSETTLTRLCRHGEKTCFFNGKKKSGSGHTWSYYIKSIFIYISCLICTILYYPVLSCTILYYPVLSCTILYYQKQPANLHFHYPVESPNFKVLEEASQAPSWPAMKPWTTMVLPWKSPKITEKDIYRRWIMAVLKPP